MFANSHGSTDEHLPDLLTSCRSARTLASRLARQAQNEALRTLLNERAERYRLSEVELIDCMRSVPELRSGNRPAGFTASSPSDIAAVWEAAECDALLRMRDALDAGLPSTAETTVLRHINDGVEALERLRALAQI